MQYGTLRCGPAQTLSLKCEARHSPTVMLRIRGN